MRLSFAFRQVGGARMQEIDVFANADGKKQPLRLIDSTRQGLPYISVLTDPTMGGVTASLAMLGGHHSCRAQSADRVLRVEGSLNKPYANPCPDDFSTRRVPP